jgi:hypothetical protein
MRDKRFPKPIVEAVHATQIIGIRAGMRPHRFIGVWAVVANGRVFVRPWTNRPRSWYRVFLEDPRGAIQVAGRTRRVRAAARRGERLLDAIDRGYREKYSRPYQRNFVRGFARPRRRAWTLELMPSA